ncbi:hypothetical protein M2451_000551 [Dysgonomonas sp. PFB1-18]|uniref:hypothetical protein n=1 Tax=unclassified Dysgonomonas TaxID=2630389 RepID=UPI0024754A4C|nr:MULTISPECIES: hypothetical protein [unclassified Dysgonomonas]MDH6307402.1 hypothetical protein [Dysgonomonas sp. PF1-14]MDH6337320.1 hypothetical protein [Dysgonomonas sp. PF1-16]MDH6379244.1 hypothetical protein [Dysgonomonas sp. PFB1-18]MDH6396118.1 hypothetical protein [Dysgonomonas sp. PF1-23]
MKNIIVISYALLIIANVIIGLVLTEYEPFNMWLVTATIAINAIFSYLIASSELQNAFKISLTSIYSVLLLIQIVLAIICNKELANNIVFIIYALSFLIQGIIGVVVYSISKK